MDLEAHIQAARRASSPSMAMPQHEIGKKNIRSASRRSIDLPHALFVAVVAFAAALALLCLAA